MTYRSRSPRRTWRLSPIRRRPRLAPTPEELAVAAACWAWIELQEAQGPVGEAARREARQLGIDVRAKYADIKRLVLAHFAGAGIDPEDLVQEVLLAILKRNGTPSAFDPSKSSFGHYCYLVAHHVVCNALEKQRRWAREVRVDTPDQVDERSLDAFDAFEHILDSPRISKARPLDRSKVDGSRSVMN